ncbi:MAG: transporter [Phyllobacteriaceae bacterium]|nr:transporter [Phyllobacteriaceae bacterium]
MKKIATRAGCLAAILLTSTTCFAGSELMPGITTGIPLGAPLPEGLYMITIPTFGTRESTPKVDMTAIAPAWMIWSTPWTIAGGRLVFDAVTPYADVSVRHLGKVSGFTNPLIEAQLKWMLGDGWFGGFQVGGYLPVQSDVGHDWGAFESALAVSYLKDGWNLSATTGFGTGHSGPTGGPDWWNLDLTATRKFGKIEVGAVAFASADLSAPFAGYAKQSQVAVGALAGYDFGPVNVQFKLTTDVAQTNYGGRETRAWANIIVPLWNPTPTAAAPRPAIVEN